MNILNMYHFFSVFFPKNTMVFVVKIGIFFFCRSKYNLEYVFLSIPEIPNLEAFRTMELGFCKSSLFFFRSSFLHILA